MKNIASVVEKSVLDKLAETYSDLEWVSKNAAKAGVNQEGSDIHGCDIRYVDGENKVHYFEVKSKADIAKAFYVVPAVFKSFEKEEKLSHLFSS